jgi:hypothetical protein
MPTPPVDEDKPNDHQCPTHDAELCARHGKKLFEPAFELFRESEIGQPLKKADEAYDRKEISP